MTFMNAKEARPVDDPKALVPFGWAPGGYHCAACSTCGEAHAGSDKRSVRCQDCAEALRDKQAAETAPTTRETADHAPDSGKMVQTPMHRDAAKATLALSGTAGHEELLRRALQDAQELSRRGLNPDIRLNAAEREAVAHVLSEIAALRGDLTVSRDDLDQLQAHFRQRDREATQAERQRDELRKALERAADDLRDIGGQSPRPSNSPDPEHENYLRRVLISLAQVGNTRARQALANQGADQ